jgi:hypothetical protein
VALVIYLQFAAAGIALCDVKKVVAFVTLYADDADRAPALFANVSPHASRDLIDGPASMYTVAGPSNSLLVSL